MRKIKRQLTNQVKEAEAAAGTSKRIAHTFNASICQQLENLLRSQRNHQDYNYLLLSTHIKEAFRLYQQGKIQLAPQRDKDLVKRELTIRWSGDLLNFYYSFPKGERTSVLERALISYLTYLANQ